MVRKPELNDALLLALAESGEKGLEIVNLNNYTPQLCCGWVCHRNV